MILETERLVLRQWREEDAEDLYKYASDDRIAVPLGIVAHKSVDFSREVIRGPLCGEEEYAVCLKEDGRVVGCVELLLGDDREIKEGERDGEISYWIGVDYWGQGLIPEAVEALARHAFADLSLDRLWCGYFDGNEKSKRVMEKCGFTYRYTKKDFLWRITGEIKTEHVFCLERAEWEQKRG